MKKTKPIMLTAADFDISRLSGKRSVQLWNTHCLLTPFLDVTTAKISVESRQCYIISEQAIAWVEKGVHIIQDGKIEVLSA